MAGGTVVRPTEMCVRQPVAHCRLGCQKHSNAHNTAPKMVAGSRPAQWSGSTGETSWDTAIRSTGSPLTNLSTTFWWVRLCRGRASHRTPSG